MVRFFLALLLAMVAVTAPVQAACSYEAPAAVSCCCETVSDSACAELSGACCDLSQNSPALPAQQNDQNLVPVGLSSGIKIDTAIAAIANSTRAFAADSKPIHLASNKIYLERRRLLI
jgi:hypothetical protein